MRTTLMRKGELTRDKILKSSQRLFLLKGYHRTSVDDILRDSKVKRGNFYFHFKSKEALGYAVIEVYASFFHAGLHEVVQKQGTSLDKIHLFFEKTERRLAETGCRGGCPFGNFALEMSDVHNGFRERIDHIFDAWTDQIDGILREGKRRGEIKRGIDTKALAHFLVAISEGATLLVKAKKDISVYRACTKSLRDMLKHAQA